MYACMDGWIGFVCGRKDIQGGGWDESEVGDGSSPEVSVITLPLLSRGF